MEFVNQFSLGDVVSVLVLLSAAIGLFLTRTQLQNSARTVRGTFFKDLYSSLFDDPDMRAAFQMIEGDDALEYDAEFHLTEQGRLLDKLLSHCELVSALQSLECLGEREMIYFSYNLKRIYENENVQKYFDQIIVPSSERQGEGPGPFSKFRSLGGKGAFERSRARPPIGEAGTH